MKGKTNVEILEDARLLDQAKKLSEEETHLLNSLTRGEVNAIISASRKLGLREGSMDNALKALTY